MPAVALLFVSLYIVLAGAGTQQCTYSGGALQRTSCSTDPTGAALVTFPAAIVCLVLCAAVFRGQPWARWPAVVVGALVGTVSAAACAAVVVSLAGDGNAMAAIFLAIGGALVSLACALPALLLAPPEGAGALLSPPERSTAGR